MLAGIIPCGTVQQLYFTGHSAGFRFNVRATRRLGEWAAVAQGVRNFVHISSPSLYFDYHHHRRCSGRFSSAAFRQRIRPQQGDEANVIHLLAQANLNTRFTILRPAKPVFGPHDKVFIPRLAQMMQHYGSVLLPRGSSALVDMIIMKTRWHAMWLASQPQCDLLPGRRVPTSPTEPQTCTASC